MKTVVNEASVSASWMMFPGDRRGKVKTNVGVDVNVRWWCKGGLGGQLNPQRRGGVADRWIAQPHHPTSFFFIILCFFGLSLSTFFLLLHNHNEEN